MDKVKVLFLCTGNSARSQIAEAYLRTHGEGRFEAYSAGMEPKGIHPLTVKVMDEVGLDISQQRSKSVDEFLGSAPFNYVIFVCDKARQSCPSIFPGLADFLYWPFEDPADFKGSEEEKTIKFREVRDKIEHRIKGWIKKMT